MKAAIGKVLWDESPFLWDEKHHRQACEATRPGDMARRGLSSWLHLTFLTTETMAETRVGKLPELLPKIVLFIE
jgi:hypothetical protein